MTWTQSTPHRAARDGRGGLRRAIPAAVRDAQPRFQASGARDPEGFRGEPDELLPRLRRWFLPQYLTLVARLLPRVSEAGGAEMERAG